jgi:diguanylate cyclase (GGDEF)-like protein
MALEVMPQIVITDWLMPVMDGLEFCRALRATEWGQSMYVIMLTGLEAESEIVDAFEAGVDDYVTKPLNVRALRARMRAALHYVKLLENWEGDRAQLKQFAAELAISNRKLEYYALTDLLTGLQNRRAGMNDLAQAWSAANRSGQPVAVMMIDIDRFKSVNDTYGHAVGDKVLIEVATAIRAAARKADSVCRMGGEEFLVVCRNTELKATLQAAERLRKKVNALRIKAAAAEIQVSLSIGVAIRESDMPEADALVNAADKALYAAKLSGRNRTCLITHGKVHQARS